MGVQESIVVLCNEVGGGGRFTVRMKGAMGSFYVHPGDISAFRTSTLPCIVLYTARVSEVLYLLLGLHSVLQTSRLAHKRWNCLIGTSVMHRVWQAVQNTFFLLSSLSTSIYFVLGIL